MHLFSKFSFIISFLFLLLHSTCADDTQSAVDNYVTGGFLEKETYYLAKYIVSIRHHDERIFGYGHFCGGAIISSNSVLTAAHCFYDGAKRHKVLSRDIMVVAGTPNRFKRTACTQMRAVGRIIFHEDVVFDPHFKGPDIAILRLKRNVIEDGKYVQRIPLINKPPYNNMNCTVYGWGSLFYLGPGVADLYYANISLIVSHYCQRLLDRFRVGPGVLCASDFTDYEKDSCQGDSGGPLVCNEKLVGLVSFGLYCSTPIFPGFYTDVWYFKEWIKANNTQSIGLNRHLIWLIPVFFLIFTLSNFLEVK